MDYLIVYSASRPPEHLITDGESDNDQRITLKYLTWVKEGICRVFKTVQLDLDLNYYELQEHGEFEQCQKEFM